MTIQSDCDRKDPIRVVLDTNILVAAAYAEHSASRRIVQGCLSGAEMVSLTSAPLNKEYDYILRRAVRGSRYVGKLRRLIERSVSVAAALEDHQVPADPDDGKVLATAVGGRARAVITNDHHLLELDPYLGIRIVRPHQFLEELLGAAADE